MRHSELGRSPSPTRPVYLDCNATSPVEAEVLDSMIHFCREEYGNAGSRTHGFGAAANRALRRAREQVAGVVAAGWEDIVFTSGSTESNNLAIFGIAAAAANSGPRHIISTQIEHKAVLEPLEELTRRGFDVTLVPPSANGVIDVHAIRDALRDDTVLVSVMHVNNETGVIQPLAEVGDILSDHPAAFHTDAAQGFGKELEGLRCERLDLISISGHKIYAPKGIGALVVRQSAGRDIPLKPLMYGGGQESGLRPGTVPVHLAVALGIAAEVALRDHSLRRAACLEFRKTLLEHLSPLRPIVHGDPQRVLPHVLNIRFDEIDSEALMIALKDLVAISNGSACTSAHYEPSHVLRAMGLNEAQANAATRWSWCHLTAAPDWEAIADAIRLLS